MGKPYRTESNGKLIKYKYETETSFAIQWRAILVWQHASGWITKEANPQNLLIGVSSHLHQCGSS